MTKQLAINKQSAGDGQPTHITYTIATSVHVKRVFFAKQ